MIQVANYKWINNAERIARIPQANHTVYTGEGVTMQTGLIYPVYLETPKNQRLMMNHLEYTSVVDGANFHYFITKKSKY